MKAHLTQLLAQAAKTVAPEQTGIDILLERPKSESHGDFSTNLAMLLAKPLRKNPRVIAEELIKALPASSEVAKAEIAGVGFINFFLASGTKARIVPQILQAGEKFGLNDAGKGHKVMVEFVSANPTGPLHVGHGRGAAVGDCLSRLLAATGWDVTREFYYNDAGAQIDNLVLSVQCRGKGITPDDPSWPEDGYRGDYITDIAQAYLAKKTIQSKTQQVTGLGD
ncbi:MAG TPA: arginine--tRNA ligase, partial [Methylophilaceae bacterium]